MPCPGTTVVDGREFENQDQFDLGTVPFRQAFAQSCNTTFIQQALELPDPALAEAAAGYGVGTDWQLPVGIFSGSVPERQHRHDEGRRRHRPGRGADEPGRSWPWWPRASPAAARRRPSRSSAPRPPGRAPAGPGQQVLDALRPMMRQVVLSGTATALADRGEVYGKTGTAEFGSNTPPDAHGWFMGYQLGGPQGDIAFAVLVEGGQSSSAAVAVTDAFLGALG